MRKNIFILTVTLISVISVLILSGCDSKEKSSIVSTENEIVSSISSVEMKRKSNSDVKADTDQEFARYKELYPNEEFIADKLTPVIQKSESNNKGYTKYVVDFFEAYNVTLTIELPEQLSIRLYSEGERLYASLKNMGVQPFYSSAVGICDKENNVIGGISSTTIMYPDDLTPGADNSSLIYQGLFTGMGNTWDIGYHPVYQTDAECTATTYISYPDSEIENIYPRDFARIGNSTSLGGGERYFFNKAILSYNTDELKYVAIEIDFDCITDEELLSVAKSVKLSNQGNHLSDTSSEPFSGEVSTSSMIQSTEPSKIALMSDKLKSYLKECWGYGEDHTLVYDTIVELQDVEFYAFKICSAAGEHEATFAISIDEQKVYFFDKTQNEWVEDKNPEPWSNW